MKDKKLIDLEEKYDLELEKVVAGVKESRAKVVVLQFPDGLKQYAVYFVDFLQEKCGDVEFRIWFGSCFGACDVPELGGGADLVVQFGHAAW